MSGYSESTGIFELSWRKIERYLPHRYGGHLPEDIESEVEGLIENSPYTYLGKNAYGYKVVANDAQVWELLSGQKANFGHTEEQPEVIYNKWKLSREWFNSTDLGKEINPNIGAVKVNRLLENLSYIERKDGGWAPTEISNKKDLVRSRGTSNAFGNKPSVELSRNLIPILQDQT